MIDICFHIPAHLVGNRAVFLHNGEDRFLKARNFSVFKIL